MLPNRKPVPNLMKPVGKPKLEVLPRPKRRADSSTVKLPPVTVFEGKWLGRQTQVDGLHKLGQPVSRRRPKLEMKFDVDGIRDFLEKKNTFTYHQKPVNTTTGSRNLPGCGNRQQEWLQSHSGGSSSKTVKLPALAIEQQSYLVQQGYGNAHCPIAKQVHADCRKLDRSVLLNQPKRTNLYAPLHPIDSNATDIFASLDSSNVSENKWSIGSMSSNDASMDDSEIYSHHSVLRNNKQSSLARINNGKLLKEKGFPLSLSKKTHKVMFDTNVVLIQDNGHDSVLRKEIIPLKTNSKRPKTSKRVKIPHH